MYRQTMEMRTTAQVIEYFHLVFLDVLRSRLGTSRYVVKGGVNLRYFFESPRYSEDIDLDAVAVEPWKLEEKIDLVLGSAPMDMLLRTGHLGVQSITKPKQTDTTQRWKLMIGASGHRALVRTKIEFSHQAADTRFALDAVADRIVAPYALRAPMMLHYTADAAIAQKVVALARRAETQARDVFDLELLLRRHRDVIHLDDVGEGIAQAAADRAGGIPYEAFRDQVLPFLDPGIADLYDAGTWDQMRGRVVDLLLRFP